MGAVVLVLAAAVGLYYLATDHGPGLSPDSVTYAHAARNLVDHHTLITAVDRTSHVVRPTHYPPLYPVALAVGSELTGGVQHAARLLQALVVAVSGGLFAALLARYARPAAVVAGVSLLVVSSGFLVEINAYVLSEGLFLCWTLATLLALLRWLDRPVGHPTDHRGLLLAAAGFAGAAALTRFVGVALIAAGAAAVLLLDRDRRWGRAALFATAAALPLLAWTVYSRSTGAGAVGERTLALHPPSLAKWSGGLRAVATWVVPARATGEVPRSLLEVTGMVVLCATAALLALLARRAPLQPRRGDRSGEGRVSRLARVAALFMGGYLVLVVLTISLLDTATPLDRRILSPVLVIGLLVVVVGADRFVGRRPGAARLGVAGVVVLALLAPQAAGTAGDIRDASRLGLGYASVTWQRSELVAEVQRLSPEVKVYSNAASALFHLTGVRAQSIVPRVFGNGSGPNPDYEARLAVMASRVNSGRSIVVWFESAHHYFGADLATLRRVIGRPPAVERADGALFRAP